MMPVKSCPICLRVISAHGDENNTQQNCFYVFVSIVPTEISVQRRENCNFERASMMSLHWPILYTENIEGISKLFEIPHGIWVSTSE